MKYKIRFDTVIDGVPYFIHHERTMTKEKPSESGFKEKVLLR